MGLSDRLHQRNKSLLTGGFSIRDYVPPRSGPYGRELHAPLANFEGPRTDIKRRLKEGVKPTTHTDSASRLHDIAYFNIGQQLKKGTITKPIAYQKVRAADNALMKSAAYNKLSINPVEHLHSNAALAGMVGKRVLQDVGAMPELAFIGNNDADTTEISGGRRRKKTDKVKGLRARFKKMKL